MADQNWSVPLFDTGGVAGAALASSTTATSLLPTASVAKGTLGAGFFNKLGKRLRFRSAYQISWISATPGNLTLDLRFGSTVIFTTGALALLTGTTRTNMSLQMEVELVLAAIGTASNLRGFAKLFCVDGTTFSPLLPLQAPATSPAVGNNFDATAAQQVDHFGTWSVSNAGNSITLLDATLISDN